MQFLIYMSPKEYNFRYAKCLKTKYKVYVPRMLSQLSQGPETVSFIEAEVRGQQQTPPRFGQASLS